MEYTVAVHCNAIPYSTIFYITHKVSDVNNRDVADTDFAGQSDRDIRHFGYFSLLTKFECPVSRKSKFDFEIFNFLCTYNTFKKVFRFTLYTQVSAIYLRQNRVHSRLKNRQGAKGYKGHFAPLPLP